MLPREGSPGKSHATAWAVALLLTMLLYVATWPVIEIKSRVKEIGKPGVFVIPILEKGPEWTRTLYRPLNMLRASHGGKNVLGEYWRFWHEQLVMIPCRERSEEMRQKRREIMLELQQLRQHQEEMRRKSEERMLELQQRRKESPRSASTQRRRLLNLPGDSRWHAVDQTDLA